MSGAEGALLAVDASGTCGPAGVALSVDGSIRVRALPGSPPRTETLAAVTETLLAQAGLGPGDLVAVGAVVGPGSYTGLRSALAFLRGLCLVDAVPAIAVHALDLLAWSGASEGEMFVTCAGAGEGRVMMAPHRRLAGDVERLAEPERLAIDDLAEALGRLPGECGSATVLLAAADPSGQVAAAAAAAGFTLRIASGDALADLASLSRSRLLRGLVSPCATLLPVYVGTSVARAAASPPRGSGAEAGVPPEGRE